MPSLIAVLSLTVLSAFSSTLRSSTALACSCPGHAPIFRPQEAFHEAKNVFLGTVVEISEIQHGSESYRNAMFHVERTWKGQRVPEARIETEKHMCGLHFVVGKQYLVYDYGDPKKNNVCSGTALAEAKPVKEVIESLNKTNADEKLGFQTSPHTEALELVFSTQQGVIRSLEPDKVHNGEAKWWFDTEARDWIVTRPTSPGKIDSTHSFLVIYKKDDKILGRWSVDTRKKKVELIQR